MNSIINVPFFNSILLPKAELRMLEQYAMTERIANIISSRPPTTTRVVILSRTSSSKSRSWCLVIALAYEFKNTHT